MNTSRYTHINTSEPEIFPEEVERETATQGESVERKKCEVKH